MIIEDILKKKGAKVVHIAPTESILEAAKLLNTNSIGAVLVCDTNENIVGILSERDILRETSRRPDRLKETKVEDVMTTDVIIGLVSDTVDYALNLMTEKRIRHLPILNSGEFSLAGMISIGDLVKASMHKAELEIHYLHDYISGKYPG